MVLAALALVDMRLQILNFLVNFEKNSPFRQAAAYSPCYSLVMAYADLQDFIAFWTRQVSWRG
jgi:hypothetical protein